MFNDNKNIKNYFVYRYQHIDDLSAVMNPIDVYSWFADTDTEENRKLVDETVKEVEKLFKKNGWEGDGKIGLIWIPPFIDIGIGEGTWGTYLWHVKQLNDGTSFIASPIPLNIKRLQDQNKEISVNDYRNMEPINIIQQEAEGFLEMIKDEKENFENEVNKLMEEDNEIFKNILEKLFGYTQSNLIAHLDDFLNECYLSILIEVLRDGNRSQIKLKKSAVKVDLTKHGYSEFELDAEGLNWMSFQMFISDIWHSFMFEPFNEKYNRLTKSLDYKAEQNLRDFLFKHIVIRNCIQHHDWQLHRDLLKSLGKSKIDIATDDNPIEITEWKTIKLTKKELQFLFDNINQFIQEFNNHVDKRVMTRHYRPKKVKNNN